MENEVRKTFFERGVVFFVSTSAWTAKDKLRPSDIGKQPVEIPDIVRLGSKDLLPEEFRVAMTTGARTKVAAFMRKVGSDFKIGDNDIPGAYWVPNRSLVAASEGLKEIRQWLADLVDGFLLPDPITGYSKYDNARIKMVADYSWLADAAWPEPDQIRAKYRIAWKVCEITPSDAKSGDADEIAAAKKQFQDELNQGFAELRDSILAEAHVAIQEACEDISKRVLETGNITQPGLRKPLKIIQQYLDVAEVFDDQNIRDQVNKLKETIEATSAQEIRTNWEVAENFAKAMKKIAEDVGDLSAFGRDGRPKRKVRLDTEPEQEPEREAA